MINRLSWHPRIIETVSINPILNQRILHILLSNVTRQLINLRISQGLNKPILYYFIVNTRIRNQFICFMVEDFHELKFQFYLFLGLHLRKWLVSTHDTNWPLVSSIHTSIGIIKSSIGCLIGISEANFLEELLVLEGVTYSFHFELNIV